ncbi:MAG: phage tail tube protein [Pseudodesulfovibrio sp.]|nr:phage tail tube protein [Pseudodesulfovibrio sp.]
MNANPNRIAGTVYVKRDGVLLDCEGEFSLGLGLPERTTRKGSHGGVVGYEEESTVPFIEGSLTTTAEMDIEAILKADGETITVEAANGKTYSLSPAWQTKPGEINASKGVVPVRWEGKNMDII